VDRMRRKLQTKVGAAIYSKRKTVVEPVFGQIKTSARLPAISLAWSAEGARRVGHDLSHAQHSEVTSALLWIELETTRKATHKGESCTREALLQALLRASWVNSDGCVHNSVLGC